VSPLALTGYEIGLLAVASIFVLFALGAALVVPRSRPDFPGKRLGIFLAVCVVLFAAQMGAVLALSELGEHEKAEAAAPGVTTPAEPADTEPAEPPDAEPKEGDTAAGKEIFLADCAGCHTLADAGTTGTIGPNLDATRSSFETAVDRVTNGAGVMPSFKDELSEQQIRDVAAYVSAAAGG
jgi:mono/diheme cytochrome c family protein